MKISVTPTRIWLSIALTVVDTQAVLLAMWLHGWDPTRFQLFALGGIAVVLLTMMGFDVVHSIAEIKATAPSLLPTPAVQTSTPAADAARQGD